MRSAALDAVCAVYKLRGREVVAAFERLSAPLLATLKDALAEVDVQLFNSDYGPAGSGMRGPDGEPVPLRAHRHADEDPHLPALIR